MLEVSGVSKQFPGAAFALDKISFCIGKGFHVLVGPNGAGKSMLLRIIATVLRADAGKVLFGGRDVYSDLYGYKFGLGYLPQDIGFYTSMTGIEFLRYMARLKGLSPKMEKQRIDFVVELLELEGHCTQKITGWSAGRRQRLGLAQALLNNPAMLILDEPFCGIDPEEAGEISRLLAWLARDRVVLISSHIMDGLAINRLLLLVNGRLRFSGLPTVFTDEARERVWTVETTRDEGFRLQQVYPVCAAAFDGSRYRCRIISRDRPAIPGASAVVPTLEDAYLYWLQQCNRTDGEERIC